MRRTRGPAAGARGVVTRLAVVVVVVMASLAAGVSGAGATPPPDAFNATAGVTFSGAVGGFFTSNCGNFGCGTLNPFVTIDWGDGATSRVQAAPTCPTCSSSDWVISGTHTYRFPGTYAASFTSVLDGDVPVPISATVGDDPGSIRPSPQTIAPVVGAQFTDVVVAIIFCPVEPHSSAVRQPMVLECMCT